MGDDATTLPFESTRGYLNIIPLHWLLRAAVYQARQANRKRPCARLLSLNTGITIISLSLFLFFFHVAGQFTTDVMVAMR